MAEKNQNKKRKKKPDLNEMAFGIVKKATDEKSNKNKTEKDKPRN